jgi:uncharacterized protein
MLFDEIQRQKPVIDALAHHYGAKRVRVFGSVARGEERADSDVDFLVELPRGYDMFTKRVPLTDRLSELLGRKVDLMPEHELNRYIREAVTREAVEI